MKILLVPSNNSLSHIAKCIALEDALVARGHSVLVAVSRKYAGFATDLGLPHAVLSDIQESDDGALPGMDWFRSPELLRHCLQAEIELIRSFRPHRVVGVFRFTLKASAAYCGVPYDSVACGCMMPDVEETLGYGPGDAGAEDQIQFLTNFYRFAGRRMGQAMEALGLAPVVDIRSMLEGDRTFLWDFPQFMPLPTDRRRIHVGPLSWDGWPQLSNPPIPFSEPARPMALMTLGTQNNSRLIVRKAAKCLIGCGYNVVVACGGQPDLMNLLPEEPGLRTWLFAPLEQLLGNSELVVCHGGQMTIFESLRHGIPLLVIPSQPEQAHNGVCLERIGCGRRLSPSVAFKGEIDTFIEAFLHQDDNRIMEIIMSVTRDHAISRNLDQMQTILHRYDGPAQLARMLEEA